MQFRDKNIEGANFRNLPERNPTFGAHSREDGAGLRDLPHTGGMGLRRISGQRRRIPTLEGHGRSGFCFKAGGLGWRMAMGDRSDSPLAKRSRKGRGLYAKVTKG